jgi:SAM-dependent methyltransferase
LPGDGALPVFDRLIGVELRPRVAAIAAAALRGDAVIIAADARRVGMEPADAVLFLDVLQMIPPDAQEALIASAAAALTPGGVIIIREADAGGGWRFRMVVLGNRLKALAFGNWRQQWYFRSVAGWETCLARFGMRVETRPMGHGTPFANVVLLITRTAAATSSTNKTDTSTAAAR